MLGKFLCLVALSALFVPTLALAQDAAQGEAREIPFLVGTWNSVENQAVTRGPGGPHNPLPDNGVTYSGPAMTLEITSQQGRVFEGKLTSANYEEDFVGGLAFDDTTLWFAEEEGMRTATLVSPTEMEVVYIHEGEATDIIAITRYLKQ